MKSLPLVEPPEKMLPPLTTEEIEEFLDLYTRLIDFSYEQWAWETGHPVKKLIRKGENGRYRMAVDFLQFPEAADVIKFMHEYFPQLIEHFVETKRTNKGQRELLDAWRRYYQKCTGVYLETLGERSALFCDIDQESTYLVYMLYDEVEHFVEERLALTTLLLPYRDRIVSDGLYLTMGHLKDEWGYGRLLRYCRKHRRRHGIVTALAPQSETELSPGRILRLKISLRGAKPPIWRRILIPADATLEDLHETIQESFEWMGMHLFEFQDAIRRYGDPDLLNDPFGEEERIRDYRQVRVGELLEKEKDRITYLYDFGDYWEHTITLEAIEERKENTFYPQCTGGRRAAPPEDCGGLWGYTELVEAFEEGDGERLESFGWEPEAFPEPSRFDKKELNARLKRRFSKSL